MIIGGAKKWEEDGWRDVQLGQEQWQVTSRCGRCLLPNVDPDTGVRDEAVPAKIMQQFRVVDKYLGNLNCFGVNATPMTSSGILRVGDRVTIKQRYGLRSDASGQWARPEDDFER